MAKFLITGSQSGLGRFLHEYFVGIGFHRNSNFDQIKAGADFVVHCAARPPELVTSKSLFPFLEDNVLLTEKLVEIPHKKFIYISSVDVYPKNLAVHSEEENIPLESISDIYGLCKLMSESIVQKTCRNHLILRCASFLGPYARSNSLIKLLEEENPLLSLSAESALNYIRHNQIAEFIKYASENNVQGIYNATSSENVTLARIAETFKRKARFGSFTYKAGTISNKKISSVSPSFEQTSLDIIHQFIKEDLPKRKNPAKANLS